MLGEIEVNVIEVIAQLAIMFLIIMTGYLAKKCKFLSENSEKDISRMVVNIFAPAFIITNLSQNTYLLITENIITISLLAVAVVAISFVIGLISFYSCNFSEKEKGVYQISLMFGNCTYLGFPLCYSLFGAEGLLYAAIYSIIQDMIFWSFGIVLLSPGENIIKKLKNLANPCMIAILFALIIMYFNLSLPRVINQTLSIIGNAAIPLALMIIGSSFGLLNAYNLKAKKIVAASVLLKLLLIPFFVLMFTLAIKISSTVKIVLLLLSALPTAATTAIVVKKYDKNLLLASKIITYSTGFSIFTIPVVLVVADFFLN